MTDTCTFAMFQALRTYHPDLSAVTHDPGLRDVPGYTYDLSEWQMGTRVIEKLCTGEYSFVDEDDYSSIRPSLEDAEYWMFSQWVDHQMSPFTF